MGPPKLLLTDSAKDFRPGPSCVDDGRVWFIGDEFEKYFLRLINNELPIKQATRTFIGNQNYIFSSYITEKQIVRQFIITQESNYRAMQTTFIPIREQEFFSPYFWQTDVFQGKNFKKSNQCLRRLMQSTKDIDTAEICKTQQKLSSFEKLGENIYSVQQRVKNVTGKIIVTNAAAVIEVSCKKGHLLKSATGLAVFLISDDCSFTMAGQVIIRPNVRVDGFPPAYVFGLNRTLNRPEKNFVDYHKIGNSVLTLVFCLIAIIIFVIICVRCSYKHTNVQYNYIAPAPEELQTM